MKLTDKTKAWVDRGKSSRPIQTTSVQPLVAIPADPFHRITLTMAQQQNVVHEL